MKTIFPLAPALAPWGLLGPAALGVAVYLNWAWGGREPGSGYILLAAMGFLAGGAMAGTALPSARPGVAAALAATYAAGGVVATGQAFLVWTQGIDEQISLAIFLLAAMVFTVALPASAAIAFALVPGRRLRNAGGAAKSFLIGAIAGHLIVGLVALLARDLAGNGAAADSLDALRRSRMLERGMIVAAIAAGVEIAFLIGASGVASMLADDGRSGASPQEPA